MKAKKLLALLLAVVFVVTQFAMLGSVSAATALDKRDDFAYGISAHRSNGYAAYTKPYDVILDTKALGADYVRVDATGAAYDAAFATNAAKQGLKVMFVNSFSIKSLAEMDYQAIYNDFYAYATALKGKDVLIQIGNEMDNQLYKGGTWTHGTVASDYNDVTAAAIGVYVANKAIHDADPSIKTIVNFSWKHYGFLEAIKKININPADYTVASSAEGAEHADWDITGLDIYADSEDDYEDVIPTVVSKFGKKVMVCETNIWPTGENKYEGDAAWLETFINYAHNNEDVIGFFVYELYDQPAYETDGWHKESHYGLIDKDGNKKDTYDVVYGLYGGTGEIAANRTIAAAPAIATNGEVKSVLYSENTYTNDVPTVYNGREIIYVDLNTTADFSQGNLIEFDFYVEDAEAFLASLNRENAKLQVNIGDVNGKYISGANYVNLTQIKNDGWNHFVISSGYPLFTTKDDGFDATQVKKITIAINASNAYTEVAGMKVGIANVCSTNISAPAMIEDPAAVIYEGMVRSQSYGRNFNWVNDNTYVEFAAVDATAGSVLEFDFYVQSAENWKAMNAITGFQFILHTKARYGNRARYSFANQVTKDGWNHIKIDLSKWENISENTPDFSQVVGISLPNWSNKSDANPYGSDVYMIANVCTALSELDKVPAMPEYAEVVLLEGRHDFKYGNNFHWTADNTWNSLNFDDNHKDITGNSAIEFDFYVESVENFQAMNAITELSAIIHTQGRWSHRACFEFKDQIKKDGWNHVTIELVNNRIGESVDYSDVAGFTFAFFSGIQDANPYNGDQVAVANVFACPSAFDRVPAANEYAVIDLYADRTFNIPQQLGWIGDDSWTQFDAVNTTAGSLFEFDLYVSSKAKFDAMAALAEPYFLIHTKQRWNNRARYNFKDQVTKDGWNHIVINRSNINSCGETPDFTQVVGFSFNFWDNTAAQNPMWKQKWRVANLCVCPAEIDRTPAAPKYIVDSFGDMSYSNTWGEKYSWTIDRFNISLTEPDVFDWSTADYIEFDMYVDSYADFKAMVEKNDELFFIIGSGGYGRDNRFTNNRSVFVLDDLITKDGWNHIKVATSKITNYPGQNSADKAASKFVSMCWHDGGGEAVPSETKEDTYKIANVCATMDAVNVVPVASTENVVYTIKADTGKATYPAKFEWLRDDTLNRNNWFDEDFSNGDYLELDFYVADYAEFQEMIAAGGELRYYIGSSTTDWGNEVGYVVVSDYVTEAGWTHIKIKLSDLTVPNGKPVLSSMKLAYLWFAKTGDSSAYDNTVYRIANVNITADIKVPTDVMAEKVSFIGAKLQNVKLGAGSAYAEFDAKSIEGTRMIELDVYVQNNPLSELTVYLMDSSNYASYTFENLTTGWNHLAVRISDLVVEGEFDATGIIGYMFEGEEGAEMFVSNFYAANYIDGDANRDGKLDLKDVVRAKKLSAGLTTIGNLLAVTGSDYKIEAADLTAVSKAVVAALFK